MESITKTWKVKGSKKQWIEDPETYEKVLKYPIYDLTIKFMPDQKLIYFIDCTCPDFSGKYNPKKIIKNICTKDNLCPLCLKEEKKEGCEKEFEKIKDAQWFPGKRIKTKFSIMDTKYYAEPCKHLKPYVEFYEKVYGFKIKVPKDMEGTDKPTAQLKREIFMRSGGHCEVIYCDNEAKHIHRKIRDTHGGKYNLWNCTHLCTDCHKKAHGNEYSHTQGK